jgi:hypothetical protein
MKYAIIATLQCFAFLVVANLASEGWLPTSEKRSVVYFGLQYGSLLSIAAFLGCKWSGMQSFFNKIVQIWKHSVMPPLAKRAVLVVVLVQLVHVCFGLSIYPFYAVGMFDWVEANRPLPAVSGQYRYFWKDSSGQTQIWIYRHQFPWTRDSKPESQ